MKTFPVLVAAALLVGCQTVGSGSTLPVPTSGSSVTRLSVVVNPKDDVHEGAATYPLGFGSGLDFVGMQKGELVFWGITDRGPNLDGPAVGSLSSKIFPAPSFHPSLAEVRVSGDTARVTKLVPLATAERAVSGLPIPPQTVGFSQEVALSSQLQDLGYDIGGLDTEAVRLDPRHPGTAWISDEYGPFILHAELSSGKILKKYAPGAGLPAILAKRQPNRGMEGLAVTRQGRLVGAVQSILDLDGKVKSSKAAFVRLVTLDPQTGKTAQFAYPLDADAYKKTADAKLGDLVALSETEFLVLEQGNAKAGARNLVYKISLASATDLTDQKTADGKELEAAGSLAELKAAGIVVAEKTLVMDLRDWGWTAEKAEGLAVLDQRRFAVISDNDFGLATTVVNPAVGADGKPVTDPTAYALAGGVLTLDGKPTEASLAAGNNNQPTAFWIFTTLKPFF